MLLRRAGSFPLHCPYRQKNCLRHCAHQYRRYSYKPLKGKTAVVTGGTRGIGFASARALAAKGASVAVLSRSAMAKDVHFGGQAEGTQHTHFACDVGSHESVDRAFRKILDTFGRVDILVNAAACAYDALLLRAKEEEIRATLDTNLLGAILVSKAAAKPMLRQNQGCIINISSIVGTRKARTGQSIYAATKAGVQGFTRSLALELSSKNIRVNSVLPGFIDTNMTKNVDKKVLDTIPFRRFGRVEDVADAVVFLSSAKYITGQEIVVDGGLSL